MLDLFSDSKNRFAFGLRFRAVRKSSGPLSRVPGNRRFRSRYTSTEAAQRHLTHFCYLNITGIILGQKMGALQLGGHFRYRNTKVYLRGKRDSNRFEMYLATGVVEPANRIPQQR